MKAIRIHTFGGPDVLKLEDLPSFSPGPGEVVVRAEAIGVNPVDTYIRSGIYGERAMPFVPGLDAAGLVKSIGTGVRNVKPGDRVYVYRSLSGTYAEEILCKETQVHRLPDTVTFDQGAAVGVPYLTAYFALIHRAQAKEGETVLIHGASGGVGIAAVQIARFIGMKVIGTAGTEKGRKLVQQEGASAVFDHRATGYLEKIMESTGGRGLDVILEMLANENLGKDLKTLAPHGRVVVIGSRGPVTIDPRDTMGRHADIRGMSLLTASDEELEKIYPALEAGLAKGALRPIVRAVIPLAEAARAHVEVMADGAHGKIVLKS